MTQPLDQILAGAQASTSTETKPEATTQAAAESTTTRDAVQTQPTQAQAPAANQQQAQTPDDAEPEVTEVAGRKMVPVEALHATRGKAKRYTEQVADLEKQIAESNKRFDESNKAWETRVNRLVETFQPRQQPQPQTQQQPEQKPDFFADPEAATRAAVESALAPVLKQVGSMSETVSRRFAVQTHGQDTVQAAYQALEQRLANDPRAMGEYQRIMGSGDPWGELVNWHKKEAVASEVGDPAAYRQKLTSEIIAELEKSGRLAPAPAQQQPGQTQAQAPAGNAAQPQGQQPPAQAAPVMPTNLATVRNAGVRSGPSWEGPQPLQDIFNRAQKPKVA